MAKADICNTGDIYDADVTPTSDAFTTEPILSDYKGIPDDVAEILVLKRLGLHRITIDQEQ